MVVVLTILFALFRIMPGDTCVYLILDTRTSTEERNHLLQKWGLDLPLWKQYILYFENFLSGDFGSSFYSITSLLLKF